MSVFLTQSVLLPLVAAAVVAVLVRLIGGGERGPRFAVVACGLAFLIAYWAAEGIPSFPPPASKAKVFYIALAALGAGLLIDAARRPRTVEDVALVLFPGLAMAWLAWRRITASPDIEFVATLAVLWAASLVVLFRMRHAGRENGLPAAIALIAAGAGAAGVSTLGASASLALHSAAIAAGVGGVALIMFGLAVVGAGRFSFGAAGLLGAGGAWLSLVFVMVLSAPSISRPALAVLLAAFFADLATANARLPAGVVGRVLGPIVLTVVAAIPAAAAVGIAYLVSGPRL